MGRNITDTYKLLPTTLDMIGKSLSIHKYKETCQSGKLGGRSQQGAAFRCADDV